MGLLFILLLILISALFSFVLIKCNVVEKYRGLFFVIILSASFIISLIIIRALLLLGFAFGFVFLFEIFIFLIISIIAVVTKKNRDRQMRIEQEKAAEEALEKERIAKEKAEQEKKAEQLAEQKRKEKLKAEQKRKAQAKEEHERKENIVLQAGRCPVCGKNTSDTDSVCTNCGFPVISIAGNIDKKEKDKIIETVKEYREKKKITV